MSRKSLLQQSHIVDLGDDALIAFIGSLYELIKLADEQMKGDAHIIRIEEELKSYKAERYTDQQKTYKVQLKAARILAKARDLKFTLPEYERETV